MFKYQIRFIAILRIRNEEIEDSDRPDIWPIRGSRAPSSDCAGQCRSRNRRVYDTLSVPNEPLLEKAGSSTPGVSRPRTRNAFQLLNSFKRDAQTRDAAVRIFSARRWHRGEAIFKSAPPRPLPPWFHDGSSSMRDFGSVIPSLRVPSSSRNSRVYPASSSRRSGKKSNSSGERRAECRRESDTNVSCANARTLH